MPSSRLNEGRTPLFYFVPTPATTRVRTFVRLPPAFFSVEVAATRYALIHLRPPTGQDYILGSVHLSSGPEGEDSRRTEAGRISDAIIELEGRVGHRRTVVIGDFNCDPFEEPLVSHERFNAAPVWDIAVRNEGHRQFMSESRPYFYNPMWSLFGDRRDGPPGTYFFEANRQKSQYWHLFDQVIVRPSFARRLEQGDITVLTEVDGVALTDKAGRPDPDRFSDHFPLLARLS